MKCEVRTRLMYGDSGKSVTLLMDVLLLPRGTGNLGFARRLGRQFREHKTLSPHIRRVVVGSSRIRVYWKYSRALARTVKELDAERSQDVLGQLGLFGGQVA